MILTNITANYVPDWTLKEALRELIQNALDADPEPIFVYDEKGHFSIITNTDIPMNCWYMGESSKRNDPFSRGKHGEGLKLALLILLREGYTVDIRSYSYEGSCYTLSPMWHTVSKELDVLCFETSLLQTIWNNETKITIYNAPQDLFEEHIESIMLPLDTPYGLIDIPNQQGALYLGHLRIADMGYKYNYNIPPHELTVERDRRVSDPYKLQEAIARLWIETKRWDDIAEGLLSGIEDFAGFSAVEVPFELIEAVERAADKLDGIPAPYYTQQVRGNVYVSNMFYSVYNRSSNKRQFLTQKTPEVIITEWFRANRSYFRKAGAKRFQELIKKSKNWRS